MLNYRHKNIILLVILTIGLLIRIVNINWSLPNDMHPYTYNIDEGTNLDMVKNFKPRELNFDTKNYISGHLGYYLFAGSIFAGNLMGFYDLVPDPEYYRENIIELKNIYVAQRLLIVLVSAAVILISFLIGKGIGNYNLGLLMAGYVALMPSILVNSQYCTVDMILVMFLGLSFLFLVKYLDNYTKKYLYLLAVSCGLALSTKHSGIFSLIFLGYAIYNCKAQGKADNWIKISFISFVIFVVSFAVTSPYLVKFKFLQWFAPDLGKPAEALAGFHWNFNIMAFPEYFWSILKIYFFEIGLVSVFSLVFIVKKNVNIFIIPLLLFTLTFTAAVLFTKYGTDSRLLPNAYFVGLLSIIGFYYFLEARNVGKILKTVAALSVIGWTVCYAGIVKYRYISIDNRVTSSEWIKNNILDNHDNVTIGLNSPPFTGFPDIITKEWMHNKHPGSAYYSDSYNETFIIPAHEWKELRGKQVVPERTLLTKFEQIKWLVSKSPEFIIVAWSSNAMYSHYGWPEFMKRNPDYKLIKHFPAYDISGISNLNIRSFDIYIYKIV